MTLYRTIQITGELELRPPRDTGGRGRGLAEVIVGGSTSAALDREDLELLRDAIDEARLHRGWPTTHSMSNPRQETSTGEYEPASYTRVVLTAPPQPIIVTPQTTVIHPGTVLVFPLSPDETGVDDG